MILAIISQRFGQSWTRTLSTSAFTKYKQKPKKKIFRKIYLKENFVTNYITICQSKMSAPNDQGNIQQNNRDNPIVGREQKMLDSSMENLSLRLTDLRGSLSSMITKLETDPNHNWPSFLNSLALISGQMNSLMKNIKSESTNKNPPLLYRRYITLPLFLSPDRDEELVKLTEGRVTTFSHDVVPHLLRTKPDPEVEARYASYENRTNSLGAETISKQLTGRFY